MQLQKPYKQAILSIALGAGALMAAHFMIPFEGENLKAYRDGAGVYTICRGHTENVKAGDTATKEQCEQWYKEDINKAQSTFDKYVHTQVPANVEAAAISFIFNAGPKNFIKSTLLKKLNKGDIVGACNEFPKWKYMSGKDCEIKSNNCYGLIVRRAAERGLCLDKNIYSSYHLNPDNIFVGVRPSHAGN